MDEGTRNRSPPISPRLCVSLVSLKLAQEIRDLGLGPVHRANELAPHHAIAVDDVNFGKFERTVEPVALAAGIAHRKQAHVVVLHELLESALVHVNAHREYGRS